MGDSEAKTEEKPEEKKKDDGASNRIMVFLRIRPAKRGEISDATGGLLMDVHEDGKTVFVKEGGGKPYNYDGVYDGPNVDQQKIFADIAVPVIDNVFKGYWGTIMVYGQTGTGKSFTMCNFSPTCPGVIPRTMGEIFRRVNGDTTRNYTINFSFIQIYLDKLQDLFNPEGPELKINRDEKGNKGVEFIGIQQRKITSEEEFRNEYEDANQHRVVRETKSNPESSRGHAALFIEVQSKPKDEGSGESIISGKLFLIDLAGYERFSKTGVQEGIMKEEAKTINASLLALGNCVQGLSEKASHIPWRNAKLTRMLQDAIGGRAKCSIILTAGPSAEHYHETTGTLYFGSRAMAVKTDAKLQLNVDYQKLAKKLQEMLALAEDKINHLEVAAMQRQLEREQAQERMAMEMAAMKKRHDDQLQALLSEGASPEKIREMMEGNKVEVQLLEEQHFEEVKAVEEQNEKEAVQMAKELGEKNSASNNQKIAELEKRIADLLRINTELEQENESLKSNIRSATSENRRVAISLNEAKMASEQNVMEANVKQILAAGGNLSASAIDMMKKDYERQLKNVTEMLKENHQLELQKIEEERGEEADKFKKLYDEAIKRYDRDITSVKDAVIAKYESEMAAVKRTSAEVQEKLKKNHLTIKKAYQTQKEELQVENTALLRQIGELEDKLESGAVMSPRAQKGPSRAELLIAKKQEEKKVKDLEDRIQELKNEVEYSNAERDQLQKMNETLKPKTDDELMQSSTAKALKAEKEGLEAKVTKLEKENLKLKAATALKPSAASSEDKEEDESVDEKITEDSGDFEGLKTYHDKLMRSPFVPQGGNNVLAYENVLHTVSQTPELPEYRQFLRYRMYMMGNPSVGKSSIVKCLTSSPPLIKNVPEVLTPTFLPISSSLTVQISDERQGPTDWHQTYIKGVDTEKISNSKGMVNMLSSAVGLGSTSSAQVVPINWEFIDHPGNKLYWEGMPPHLLPIKNVIYSVCYNISQPIELIKESITTFMSLVHSSVHMKRSKGLGLSGDEALRVGVVLLGSHRDSMKDGKEPAVVNAMLSRITAWVGELLFNLKNEDSHHGITVVGNYAVSCKDWTVQSTAERNSVKDFKDLLQVISTSSSLLYPIRPACFVPMKTTNTSSMMSYMSRTDAQEGDALRSIEKVAMMNDKVKRLRKGIITLMTCFQRERRQKWITAESDVRSLIQSHLNLPPNDPKTTCYENFLLRELIMRGLITVMPFGFAHETTMPPSVPIELHELGETEVGDPRVKRDTVLCLDPMHLIQLTGHFLLPIILTTSQLNKDDKVTAQVLESLQKRTNLYWQDGLITADVAQCIMGRQIKLHCDDVKLVLETACVMGLALQAKQEGGVLSPTMFTREISPLMQDYLPFLLCTYGDGIGRKYTMNAPVGFFFHRLQVKLMPFSHTPTPTSGKYNWNAASYLVLEKSRFKWGVIGSSALKASIVTANAPIRGLLKIEGNTLYVVLCARAGTPAAMAEATKVTMDAVHQEITLLCRREFRGVRVSYQEMTLTDVASKRAQLPVGVRTILSRHKVPLEVITQQLGLVKDMGMDGKGLEIDNALQALFTAVPTA